MVVDIDSRSHNPWSHGRLDSQHATPYPQGVPVQNHALRIPTPPSNHASKPPQMHFATSKWEPPYGRVSHPSPCVASSVAPAALPASPAAGSQYCDFRPDSCARNLVDADTHSPHNAASALRACAGTPAPLPPAPFGREGAAAGAYAASPQHHKQQAWPPGYTSQASHPQVASQANTFIDRDSSNHFISAATKISNNHSMNMAPQVTDRVSISGILNDVDMDATKDEQHASGSSTPSSSIFSMPQLRYGIKIRQQPIAARSCGFGERDRRVVDPPPIVQVTIEDHTLSLAQLKEHLGSHSTMHCTIFNEKGDEDCSRMVEDSRTARRLMGTVVSVPFFGKDEFGEDGCFFTFPDLSCRTPGAYRLKFRFIVLDPRSTQKVPIVASAMSDPVTVYQAKDFPGMQRSTALARRLKQQGCPISIKRGNDRGVPGPGGSNDGSDDDSDDSMSGVRKRKRKV